MYFKFSLGRSAIITQCLVWQSGLFVLVYQYGNQTGAYSLTWTPNIHGSGFEPSTYEPSEQSANHHRCAKYKVYFTFFQHRVTQYILQSVFVCVFVHNKFQYCSYVTRQRRLGQLLNYKQTHKRYIYYNPQSMSFSSNIYNQNIAYDHPEKPIAF